MSELMTPIPFRQLMTWITTEYAREGSVFGVRRPYRAGTKSLPIFGEKIETPFGPAAGPNTQLAQNIVAGYYGGARFFELKTVQVMDGEELATQLLETLLRIAPAQTRVRYKLPEDAAGRLPEELLELACRGRGWLLSGGRCDTERAASLVLDEFRAGKLGRITLETPEE